VHVDDCVITGSSPSLILDTEDRIAKLFKVTSLGPISWLLGLEIIRDRANRSISINQTSYISTPCCSASTWRPANLPPFPWTRIYNLPATNALRPARNCGHAATLILGSCWLPHLDYYRVTSGYRVCRDSAVTI
jgi:hypothetical protein